MRSVISVYLNGQTIECRRETAWKLGLELSVAGAVGQMREPCLARPDLLRHGHRLGNAQVSWVLRAKERVEYENTYTPEGPQRRFGELFGVGDVAKVSDPISVHRDRTVWHKDWQYVDIANPKTFSRRD